jgi:hypothetical protein
MKISHTALVPQYCTTITNIILIKIRADTSVKCCLWNALVLPVTRAVHELLKLTSQVQSSKNQKYSVFA